MKNTSLFWTVPNNLNIEEIFLETIRPRVLHFSTSDAIVKNTYGLCIDTFMIAPTR